MHHLVIDNGSSSCCAGFDGEKEPQAVFANVVTRNEVGESCVGLEASSKDMAMISDISYPVRGGVVQNWDDMEKVWHHLFCNELHVTAEDHAVLMSEPPLNPKQNRETTTSIMFEALNVPAFYLQNTACLALVSTGRTNGLVIDVGLNATHVVSVYEGYSLSSSISRSDIGGNDLDQWMNQMLCERGYPACLSSVRDMKEQLCYVALEPGGEEAIPKDYKLPDGSTVTLKDELHRCPEALFDPALLGSVCIGIDQLAMESVMSCDVGLRRNLLNNIVFGGGSSLFPGSAQRLTRQLFSLCEAGMNVKVIAPPERRHAAWLGGSILAGLDTFQCMWVSKEDYDDCGPGVVHRKCVAVA